MPESFGARLRRQRERRNVTLAAIAEQTKIHLPLLEELEHDKATHWPSGIFRRAFIRAYAHAIGLEPDVIVREFLDLYPDPAEVELVEPMPAIAAALDGHGAPTRLRYLVASAVGSLARRRARTTPESIAPSPARSILNVKGEPVHRESPAARVPAERVVEEPATNAVADVPPAAVVAEPAIVAASPAEEPATPVATPAPTLPVQHVAAHPAEESVDLPAIAELCTHLGQVSNTTDLPELLQEAARILDASGLVVWIWDPVPAELGSRRGAGRRALPGAREGA